MAELILRAAALDAIDGMKPMQGNMEQLAMKALCWAAVKSIPAVDAVPVVHGRWKPTTHGFPPEPTTVCSNCGLGIDYEICKRIKADSFSYTSMKPNYCPRCGAFMVEGK